MPQLKKILRHLSALALFSSLAAPCAANVFQQPAPLPSMRWDGARCMRVSIEGTPSDCQRSVISNDRFHEVLRRQNSIGIFYDRSLRRRQSVNSVGAILANVWRIAIPYFRSQFPSCPVIVLSGAGTVEKATTLFKQGVVEFLSKPIDQERLLGAVKKAVNEGGWRDKFAT